MDLTPQTIDEIKSFVLKTDDISKDVYRAVKPFLGNHSTAVLKFVDALKRYHGGTLNQDMLDFIDIVIDDWGTKDAAECRVNNQTSDTSSLWPGWQLISFGYGKRTISDAELSNRWFCAGNACGWLGASKTYFIALKTSPIWKRLGEGVGGFNDTYGLAYPPFAIGTDIDWEEASEAECERAGLITKNVSRPLTRGEQDIRDAVRKYGMPTFNDF